jgi:hypothetical protein
MSRKLKVIGLAALAVLAVSAVSASAAHAAQFTSQAQKTFLHGVQATQNVFTTVAGEVKCNVATFEGTQEGTADGGLGFTSQEAIVHPTYSSCTAFGFPAEVNTDSCQYTLTAGGQVTILNCTTPIKITIPIAGCNVTVGNQGPLSSVSYDNEGSGSTADILVTSAVTGIHYISSGGSCGSAGEHTDGKYTGSVTVKGYSDSGHTTQVGIAWDAV